MNKKYVYWISEDMNGSMSGFMIKSKGLVEYLISKGFKLKKTDDTIVGSKIPCLVKKEVPQILYDDERVYKSSIGKYNIETEKSIVKYLIDIIIEDYTEEYDFLESDINNYDSLEEYWEDYYYLDDNFKKFKSYVESVKDVKLKYEEMKNDPDMPDDSIIEEMWISNVSDYDGFTFEAQYLEIKNGILTIKYVDNKCKNEEVIECLECGFSTSGSEYEGADVIFDVAENNGVLDVKQYKYDSAWKQL